MCGLCGLWGNVAHWSSASSRAVSGGAAGGLNPLRERALQVRLLDRVAGLAGAQVEDWAGSSWIVRGASGATEIVDALPLVWPALERLAGKPIDPLSDAVIERLWQRQQP
ncbi:hypothetical protein [Ramlibacter sp.]|uniref:hypothetical protein n=1 Tax=Ramlibacter sp. TaxID=1917967 RepID=UPI002D245533|nr:hypothetical protein [Ramlibacter sp.]HYD75811.1 hypothetical protein [Ramlibacter sp.]